MGVFIFMYDQAWLLWERLFDAMAGVLRCDRVEMDTSVFAWALEAENCSGAAVGSNFGRPHRDDSYSDCHTADGKLTIATVWVPLVPVTATSGCMYVVPANHDPLFTEAANPLHMQPEWSLPWQYIRPLSCSAG